MDFDPHEPETPHSVRWGRWLLSMALGTTVVFKGAILAIPKLKQRGLDELTLAILLPIWAIGIAGVILLLFGWIRHPTLESNLDVQEMGLGSRPDGQIFGGFTKGLAVVTLGLIWISLLGVLLADDPSPLWQRGLIFYGASCYLGMAIYLSWLYDPRLHLATSTYLNLLKPFVAFVLAPVTWPLLIDLNLRVNRRDEEWTKREGEEHFGNWR